MTPSLGSYGKQQREAKSGGDDHEPASWQYGFFYSPHLRPSYRGRLYQPRCAGGHLAPLILVKANAANVHVVHRLSVHASDAICYIATTFTTLLLLLLLSLKKRGEALTGSSYIPDLLIILYIPTPLCRGAVKP